MFININKCSLTMHQHMLGKVQRSKIMFILSSDECRGLSMCSVLGNLVVAVFVIESVVVP